MVLADPILVSLLVASVFERLNIAYFIGGSLASSLQGMPRATHDVDMIADLRTEHVNPLTDALQASFYIDPEMIQDAIRRRSTFNIIYLPSMLKVDIFILRKDPLSQQEMARRQSFQIGDTEAERLMIASAEDMILQKLNWYRRGGETSDRQWNDVLGVIKVATTRLDLAYLMLWAPALGVEDLLVRVLEESGLTALHI